MTNPTPTSPKEGTGKQGKTVSKEDLFIIGIGASAGGLQALDTLFSNIPQDSVSYVVVQHVGHEQKSMMKDLLQRNAHLQIREIEHDMEVEMNKIYIQTQRQYVTLRNGRLQLTEPDQHISSNRTFDVFFSSLAADKGPRSVAVVLSGTGTDGTEGIAAVKRAGGLVIVQDPATAKFEGMPNSAIASGVADFILPPELMPDEIFNFVKVTPLTKQLTDGIFQQEESTFLELLQLVHDRTGIDFSNYKRPTIIRRITRRMAVLNINGLLEYLDYLHLHPEEIETLSSEFLINVTKFFRDEEAFVPIREMIIPELCKFKRSHDQLRIWVAGCSSGEEPYSLAILVREHLDQMQKELDVKIFASDIDRDALAFAGKGLYPASSLSHLSPERIDEFFVKEEGKYRVCQKIRKMVIFAPHNVITAPPFSKIDLVSCRNMLIYLNPLLQKKVLAKFHYALNLGGFLFLGSSESVGDMKNFVEVSKKWKIYRNVEAAQALGLETFANTSYTLRPASPALPVLPRDSATRDLVQHNFAEILSESVLEEFGYAAVFVDESYDIIHALGDYNQFLNLPAKALNLNLLKMVPADLATTLGTLLRTAIKEKQKTSARGVTVQDKDLLRRLNLVVKPFLPDKKVVQRFLLVLFSEEKAEEIVPLDQDLYRQEHSSDARVAELEMELQHTKEDLQSVVEELETANEELQSTNEELLSSNEELQSTNEELQSLNEEHQYKIKALIELDDDLNNYFRSTDLSQIFVDRKLEVRKYTPAAIRQINLIESDIGRSIYQISNNLRYDHLIEDLRQVIANPTVIEKEVQDKYDRWYQMRILPYVTQNKQTDGAILIFLDITELRNLNALNRSVLDASLNGIQAFRAVRNSREEIVDFELLLMNSLAELFLGREAGELMGKRLLAEFPESRSNGTLERYVQVVETGEREQFESQVEVNGELRWLRSVVVKNGDGCVLTFEDITGQKSADLRLRESVAKFMQLLEAFPQITWTNHSDGTVTSFNQNWFRYTGLTFEETKGLGWQQVVHPDDLAPTMLALQEAFRTGTEFTVENRYRRADGQYRWHLNRAVPIKNEQGEIQQWVGTATDIHDLKLIQQQLQESQQQMATQNRLINTILANLPFILYRLGPDGMIEDAIGSGLRNLGLADNEIRGQYKTQLFPGSAPYISRVLAGESVSYLNTYQVGDATLYKQHYFIPDPETGGAIGFCLDVTEQKAAEEEASYHNRMLDKLLNNMPIALGIMRSDGTYLSLRGKGLRGVGVQDDELVGANVFEVFPTLTEHIKQVLTGEQVNFVSGFDADGGKRYFQFFGFFDQQRENAILFAIDISNSILFQEQLKAEKDFTETVLENSITGIVAFDRAARITAWNKTMESFTGLRREEVLGQDIFTLFPEYEVNDEGKAVRDALDGKTTTLHDHPFGIRTGLYECTTVPLLTHQQDVIGGLSIVHDISERKRLEEERINLKLTQQKEVLHAILETQEAERRRIAEALHNGLGQLLYAAKLHLEELDVESVGGNGKTKESMATKKNLEVFLDEAIKETRTISFEMVPTVLEDFGLETAVRELCKRLSKGSIKFSCFATGLEKPLEDQQLKIAVYRIVQELLNNIIKHAQAEEGIIHLERKKNRILIIGEDNGVGFDQKKVAQEKKGIGLISLQNRVKLMGGSMKIRSKPGKGTIVTIQIPLAQDGEKKKAE